MTCDRDAIVSAEDLGMTDDEVRAQYPDAIEYTALDGRPCWRRSDLRDHDGEGQA